MCKEKVLVDVRNYQVLTLISQKSSRAHVVWILMPLDSYVNILPTTLYHLMFCNH